MAEKRRPAMSYSSRSGGMRNNAMMRAALHKRGRFDDDDFDRDGFFQRPGSSQSAHRQPHSLNTENKLDLNQVLAIARNQPHNLHSTQTRVVHFFSYLPQEYLVNDCHVRVIFFTEDTIHDHPVYIDNQIEPMLAVTDSKGQKAYRIVFNARVPVNSDSEIVYFYVLECPGRQGVEVIFENRLLTQKKVRYLDMNRQHYIQREDRMMMMMGSHRRHEMSRVAVQEDNQAPIEIIDGILSFGVNEFLHPERIRQLKQTLLRDQLQLDYLKSPIIIDPSSNILKRLLKKAQDLEKFVLKDTEYLKLFEKELIDFLNEFLPTLSPSLSDWQNLVILTCIYLCQRFNLELAKDQQAMIKLAHTHRSNKLEYLNNLNNLFPSRDDEKNKLSTVLKSFLDSNRSVHSINMIIVYYHTLKTSSESFYTNLLDMKSNRIEQVANLEIASRVESNDIASYFSFYSRLIEHDFMVGALMASYFSPSTSLNQLIEMLPVQALFYWFVFKTFNRNDEFERSFISNDTKSIYMSIVQRAYSTFQSLQIDDLLNLFVAVSSTLRVLIDKYSKEHECILASIRILCSMYSMLKQSRQDVGSTVVDNEHPKLAEIIDTGFSSITDSLSNWFGKEFSDSVLVGFGVRSVPREDIDNNRRLIADYKRMQSMQNQHSSDMLDTSDMSDSLSRQLSSAPSPQEIRHMIRYFGLNNEAVVYDQLFAIDFLHDSLNAKFRAFLLDVLFRNRVNSRIQSGYYKEVIEFRVEFDFVKHQSFADRFTTVLDRLICEQLVNAKSDQKADLITVFKTLRQLRSPNQELLKNYVSYLLDRVCPPVKQNDRSQEYVDMEFVLKWDTMITLLKIDIEAKDKNLSLPLINPVWRSRIDNMIKLFGTTCNRLVDFTECIGFIKLVEKYLEKSFEVYKIVNQSYTSLIRLTGVQLTTLDQFKQLVSVRVKEVNMFEHYRVNLAKFLLFCAEFRHIDTSALTRQIEFLNSQTKLELMLCLNQVCESISASTALTASFRINDYQPIIVYFEGVRSEFLSVVQKINKLDLRYCVVFKDYFNQASTQLLQSDADCKINLGKLIEKSWRQSHERWMQIARSVESGQVKLIDLDQFTKTYFGNDFAKFCNEFIYINSYFQIKDRDLRNNQIILYNKFKMSYSAAVEIDKIHKRLKLHTEFVELNDLLSIKSAEFNQWSLSKMDSRIQETVKVLEKINDQDKLRCLNAYTESLNLVEWLRGNAPTLSELKFLVDLASMSSSTSNDTSLDKAVFAKTLKEAGTAFAALIYELNVEKTSFYEFMNLCERVCSHLESDRSIAQKLLGVKDKVDLLEEIKKKKGNVELSSLEAAKDINQKGMYRIRLDQRPVGTEESIQISDLISLEVKTASSSTVYKYENLRELQNILMLIAPRRARSESTENAMQVDTAESTSLDDESATLEYFIELFSNVNRLAEVYLRLLRDGCIFFDSFDVKIHSDITGQRLNVDKLPVLEISLYNNNIEIKDTTSPTLVSIGLLCSLMEHTLASWTSHVASLRDQYVSLNYFCLKQIRFLLINLSVAIRKSSTLGEYETRMIESFMSIFGQDINLTQIVAASESIKSDKTIKAIEMNGVVPYKSASDTKLEREFVDKWTSYLKEQDQIESKKETDLMTLKHLSLLLTKLYNESQEIETNRIVRVVPGYLSHPGEPNLIVCPSREQISIVLSMYAMTPSQPLPQQDEVLFCTQQTTSEQIQNFLRVVFNSETNHKKIYAMMNIQDLVYEVASDTEKFLESSSPSVVNKSDSYVLVMTCTEEKHSQSLLATLYSKNRIKPVVLSIENIESYLTSKLCGVKRDRGFKLSNFDPDLASTRVLISRRSGNGKSLFVKDLVDKISNQSERFNYQAIRIKSPNLNIDNEIDKLFEVRRKSINEARSNDPTIYHIDIAYEVFNNLDYYLFSLVALNHLKHSNGMVWKRNVNTDLYLIEISPAFVLKSERLYCIHSMINYLPKLEFKTPKKYLYELQNGLVSKNNMFDSLYKDPIYQRSCFYIKLVNEFREKRVQKDTKERVKSSDQSGTLSAQLKSKVVSYAKLDEIDEILNQVYDSTNEASTISPQECLEILMKYSGLIDPSWHEIKNYCSFLSRNLELVDNSDYIKNITGLRALCMQLVIVMANDFGLSSLKMNNTTTDRDIVPNVSGNSIQSVKLVAGPKDQVLKRQEDLSGGAGAQIDREETLIQITFDNFEIAEERRWENLVHPYIIVNADQRTITFIGTYLDRTNKTFYNPNTLAPMSVGDMFIPRINSELFLQLIQQKVPIFDNFNTFIKEKKNTMLCKVMGLNETTNLAHDPDPSYELTLDNCLKMLAIYLRFQCHIPVVIMGETGCGKTSLVRHLSHLVKRNFERILIHVKVHGGTSSEELERRLVEAENLSRVNYELFEKDATSNTNPNGIDKLNIVTTILFFDEANTTEHVGLIKEIMCDLTVNGRPIDLAHGLKIVAAVNPYRKHSPEMIEKLENAGLGFYMSSSETKEKLGHIPIRHLVYRVQQLPTSLMPLVWDYGQLEKNVERQYIENMVRKVTRKMPEMSEEELLAEEATLCDLLCQSQEFMRRRNDECSFVSIRDIERVVRISEWFLTKKKLIFERMNAKQLPNDSYQSRLSPLRRAFILAVSVCYHASLYSKDVRSEYRKLVSERLKTNLRGEEMVSADNVDWIYIEILKCQNVFLDEIDINKKNIAKNLALLENVFMMIICIELRIPLFIVGKPGSSKSLAKTIVAKAMEGRNSKSELFQNLKETYFVNFQCSPLTTSEMILKAFSEAARFQESSDIEKSIAVVNLDEIGLAEGSEAMPLKALHPLLESGSDSADAEVSKHFKVGVIGISNWALDPAKMNRGIFVSRGEPDIEELIETAKGICEYDQNILYSIQPYLQGLAQAYLDLCAWAREVKREFFGLRDYYSLIKMIYYFCSRDGTFTWSKLVHSVRRNFNGLEIDPLEPFKKYLYDRIDKETYPSDPKYEPIDLIESALKGQYVESNSRYLLFLTENSSSIDIIQSYMIDVVGVESSNLSVIFGSSFRADQEYTEICRNISLIKHSMEIGKTIILLNSYNLYESLYDALNQYYYEFAGQKYVDLGLGTHRIKCSVNDSFKLIIIAEKSAVYDSKRFPIPLINRLEKHFLNSSIMLSSDKLELVEQVDQWVRKFATCGSSTLEPGDVFIGFNSDTVASLMLQLSNSKKSLTKSLEEATLDSSSSNVTNEELIRQVKINLLKCATPDSVLRASSSIQFRQQAEREFMWTEYFVNQKHLCLRDFLVDYLANYNSETCSMSPLIQLTTHSNSSLVNLNLETLKSQLSLETLDVCLLDSFDTQQQFLGKLKEFTSNAATLSASDKKSMLLIQGDMTTKYSHDLISCVRYQLVELIKSQKTSQYLICLIVRLPKENVRSFIGFQLGFWSCYHIDEIDEPENDLPDFTKLKGTSLSTLLLEALQLEQDESEQDEIKSNMKGLDLSVLLKKLAHIACSKLQDTNLTRTISRIQLFIKLCDYKPFVWTLTDRLCDLQYEKESEYMGGRNKAKNWLIDEAASLGQMNQYATLRKSCQNYFSTRLSPLIGYLLSFVDLYSNLDILHHSLKPGSQEEWKRDLWLQLFSDKDLCKLNYASMRMESKGRETGEMKIFECKSELVHKTQSDELDNSKKLVARLPFFWLLIDHLNNLYQNFIESQSSSQNHPVRAAVSKTGRIYDLSTYSITVSSFFESNSLYIMLDQIVQQYNEKEKENNSSTAGLFVTTLIEDYIHDFIMINCSINSTNDLSIITSLLKSMFNSNDQLDQKHRRNLSYSLPIIHFLYEQVRQKLELYLKFSSFEPRINQSDNFKSVYKNWTSGKEQKELSIHLDSCIEAIRLFKADFKYNTNSLNRIFELVQLISHLMMVVSSGDDELSMLDEEDKTKLTLIEQQFESLTLLRLVLNFLIKYDSESLLDDAEIDADKDQLYKSILTSLNVRYFKENVNFKTKRTIDALHEFIVFMFASFKEFIAKAYGSNQEQAVLYVEEHLNMMYVDVVEMLCFRDNKRPNDDAIETILHAMTDRKIPTSTGTSSLTLGQVHRYLLVQIVFINYNEIVEKNLTVWFNTMNLIGQNKIFASHEEMAILFLSCVFDYYVNQTLNESLDRQISSAHRICQDIVADLTQIDKMFNEKKIFGKSYNVKYLLLLARIRFVTNVLVKSCHSQEALDSIQDTKLFEEFCANMKRLIEYSQSRNTDTLINYLIKEIIRKYGSTSVKFLLYNEPLSWMTPREIIGDDQKVTDRYVLMGARYLQCKEAIQRCIQVKNALACEDLLAKSEDAHRYLPYMCVAFYQNITLLYKTLNESASQMSEIFKPLLKLFKLEEKYVANLLSNSYTNRLAVNADNWKHIEFNLVLVQLKYAVVYSESYLIKPLGKLLTESVTLVDKFLPTMPQDELYDVKVALGTAMHHETTRFYACPNGHIYTIGNCGRPWVTARCSECNEPIGGANHNLTQSNKDIDTTIQDRTLKGYCIINQAKELPDVPGNIRELNSPAYHIEKFIINACMYLACGDRDENVEDVKRCMAMPHDNVKEFFWDHMHKDLDLAAKSLNLTIDEIYVLLHRICFEMITYSKEHLDEEASIDFNTKPSRQTWENMFNKEYLHKYLTKPSDMLLDSNQTIKEKNSNKDEENQAKIYFMAYELLNANPAKALQLYENEKFWKFRPLITFDLMSVELSKSTRPFEYMFLKKFNSMLYNLQLLSNLSDILGLVLVLTDMLNKSIFKSEAKKKTIRQFVESNQLTRDWPVSRVKKCVEAIQHVWAYAKLTLNDHIHSKISTDFNLTMPLNSEFTMDTQLSFLLPTISGDGFNIYSLIHYLCSIQNEILEFFENFKKSEKCAEKHVNLFVNSDYLIKFDKNDDLLRIVRSNFTYDSEKLLLSFRYDNIEYQIIDKIVRNKPRVDLRTLPRFEYSDEINDFSTLKQLNESAPQEAVEMSVQIEIVDEFKKIDELSEALNMLKIVINYAITTRADAEQTVSSFIRKIYAESAAKHAEQMLKTKIVEHARIKFLKHVWLLLSVKRAVLYTMQGQDPFESLNSGFKEEDPALGQLVSLRNELPVKLTLLVTLYQIIIFILARQEGSDVQEYGNILVSDMFDSLEDLSSLILIANRNKLPNEFPVKMRFIGCLWTHICHSIKP